MKKAHILIAVLAVFMSTFAVAGEGPPSQEEMPISLMQRVLSADALDLVERNHAMSDLNGLYVKIGREVRHVLANQAAAPGRTMKYLSPLHCAILIASFWQLTESEGSLLDLVDYRLESASMPPGLVVPGSYFFPAADALARMRVRPDLLLSAMSSRDEAAVPLLTWVLVVGLGRDSAAALVRHRHSQAGTEQEKVRLAGTLAAIEAARSEGDLLPKLVPP